MFLPSNYKRTGTKARLQTGLIDITFGSTACLRFSYHMYGVDMGTLNVKVKNQDGSIVNSFTKSGIVFTSYYSYLRVHVCNFYRFQLVSCK